MGDTTFLGAGMTVDTSKVFTVVTQFITSVSNPLADGWQSNLTSPGWHCQWSIERDQALLCPRWQSHP
jgi:hypothetical protein